MSNAGDAGPTDLDHAMICVGFWRRVVAALVDAGISWALFPLSIAAWRLCFARRTILPEVALEGLHTFAFVYMVVRFGATPGKLVVGARIVDAQGHFLPWQRALIRLALNLAGSGVDLLQWHSTLASAPPFAATPSFMQIGKAMQDYGGVYGRAQEAFVWVTAIDILVVLTNRRRRAIHDFMAGSYVVTRDSWLRNRRWVSGIPSRPGV